MTKQGCHRLWGIRLGFLAGSVDTLGFLALFAVHSECDRQLHPHRRCPYRPGRHANPAQVPGFPGVHCRRGGARLMVASCGRRQRNALRPAFVLELVLLALFMVAGIILVALIAVGQPGEAT